MRGIPPPRPISKIFCPVYFLIHPHILCEFHKDQCTFSGRCHTSEKFRSMRGTPPSRPIWPIFNTSLFLVKTNILVFVSSKSVIKLSCPQILVYSIQCAAHRLTVTPLKSTETCSRTSKTCKNGKVKNTCLFYFQNFIHFIKNKI